MNPNLVKVPRPEDRSSLATLQVDMIADLVCPWCYLGKRRLDDALLAVHGPTAVSWFPFRVNPQTPDGGIDFEQYLASRSGSSGRRGRGLDELAAAGRAEGIEFRFDRITRMPNTLDAHRVVKLAETEDVAVGRVAESLFRGFFEEGRDLADRDSLIELGERGGLPAVAIARTLDDAQSRQAVLSQEAQIRKSGVTGVPDFLVNRRLFVMGAQDTDALVNVFDRVMFGDESDRPVSPVLH
ncbi:MAG TPA: DsbA family oxidoreductase [Woeseiaceae bacterium]|nr:DsbA family oxidoreductase [Woeseiaceae bacterium]